MVLLELRNVNKIFSGEGLPLAVLHDISFNVEQQEMLAITGRSGSGKSTLMHILGCLDLPTSGTYLFEGKNVAQLSPNELAHIRNKKIGFVFQQFNLLDDMTALDNVALPQLYSDANEEDALKKATEMLQLMNMSHRLNHYPRQLSGGEQQRVAIARALVNDPTLIIADEPTGNLDSKNSNEVIDLFIHLNTEHNMTIILVTHDLSIAQRAKRIIHISDGQIVQE